MDDVEPALTRELTLMVTGPVMQYPQRMELEPTSLAHLLSLIGGALEPPVVTRGTLALTLEGEGEDEEGGARDGASTQQLPVMSLDELPRRATVHLHRARDLEARNLERQIDEMRRRHELMSEKLDALRREKEEQSRAQAASPATAAEGGGDHFPTPIAEVPEPEPAAPAPAPAREQQRGRARAAHPAAAGGGGENIPTPTAEDSDPGSLRSPSGHTPDPSDSDSAPAAAPAPSQPSTGLVLRPASKAGSTSGQPRARPPSPSSTTSGSSRVLIAQLDFRSAEIGAHAGRSVVGGVATFSPPRAVRWILIPQASGITRRFPCPPPTLPAIVACAGALTPRPLIACARAVSLSALAGTQGREGGGRRASGGGPRAHQRRRHAGLRRADAAGRGRGDVRQGPPRPARRRGHAHRRELGRERAGAAGRGRHLRGHPSRGCGSQRRRAVRLGWHHPRSRRDDGQHPLRRGRGLGDDGADREPGGRAGGGSGPGHAGALN
eukprot:COSAG01_NODE_3501_length_6001_cov_5.894443_3_plen_495_part_00